VPSNKNSAGIFKFNQLNLSLKNILLEEKRVGKGPKIIGNFISQCGTGIKTSGIADAQISGNTIDRVKVGVDVDKVFEGEISHNRITQAELEAIRISEQSPYDYFGIPKEIDLSELRDLFKKLDASPAEKQIEIIRESSLARIDQFTSIIERVIGFSKEYGPVLMATFGPYFSSTGLS